MYSVPQDFHARLTREFDGRLRVRWSQRKQEFHVEQKIRRGLLDFPVESDSNDDHIRLRDGYLFLFSVRPGSRMPCPRCASELKVPQLEIREVVCDFCKLMGKEYRVPAGYFPLNDQLIEYLKTVDPLRSQSSAAKNRVDKHNLSVMAAQQQEVLNRSLGHAADDFTQIVGIPMTGYSKADTRPDRFA